MTSDDASGAAREFRGFPISSHLSADPIWREHLRNGPPCPSWCDHADSPGGHPYWFDPILGEPGEPLFQRVHRRHLSKTADVALDLEHDERTLSPGTDPILGPLTIWLRLRHGIVDLTSTTARQLAAGLLDAADELDTHAGPPSTPEQSQRTEPTAARATAAGLSPTLGAVVTDPPAPRAARAHLGGRPLPGAWAEPVATWLDWLDAGQRSGNTLRAYRRQLYHLAQEHADPWAVKEADLVRWLNQPVKASINRHRQSAAGGFYAWAVSDGRASCSPVPEPSAPCLGRPLPGAWTEPVAAWLDWLDAGQRAPNTLRTYRQQLYHLAQEHADPWAVTEADLVRWLNQPVKASTNRQRQKVVTAFYVWAVRSGHVIDNPTEHLASIRVPRALPRPTPTHVLRQALDQADARIELALALAAYAGLRRAEIAGLHTRDLHPDALHITGKGLKERLVPLHPELGRILSAELDRRRHGATVSGWHNPPAVDGWFFPGRKPGQHISPTYLGKLIGATMGPGWTPHTIRHRFATEAYAAQLDLRAVQELLGHSDPATTARYAAVPEGALSSAVAGVRLV